MGVAGRHCRHCHLDDLITAWELRLFQLTAVGRGGGHISAEDAVRRTQLAARQRVVGRGGLNEEAGNAVRAPASSPHMWHRIGPPQLPASAWRGCKSTTTSACKL
jgi:hypothetical protein